MSLDNVCALLNAATDEQNFVGLLLATKLTATPEALGRIFDAAIPLVQRLLFKPASDIAASHCRKLALSVLASVGSDAALAARRDFCMCASAAAPLLLDGSADTMTVDELADCTAVLGALLRQPSRLADPAHGCALSTAVAPAAARAGAGSSPVGAAAAACGLIELLGEVYAIPIDLQSSSSSVEAAAAFTVAAECATAAHTLCPAIGCQRDALALARLRALRALVEAASVQLEHGRACCCSAHASATQSADQGAAQTAAEAAGATGTAATEAARTATSCAAAMAAAAQLAPELRAALFAPMASKLSPAARADVLRVAAAATQLCGPSWVVSARGATATAAAGSSSLDGGALLTLLLQLCSVELQMCMHDQPSGETSASCLSVLPACCSLLEEGLFRLHSDAADCGASDGEEAGELSGSDGALAIDALRGDGSTAAEDPWLLALSDEQMVSAQQAFQRALMVSLEYLEAVRTEDAERMAKGCSATSRGAASANAPPTHALLPVVARLVSAWLAQPSAAELMELYDRACSLLPMLRAAVASEPDDWARYLCTFERAARNGPPDDDAEPLAGAGMKPPETMAEVRRSEPRLSHAVQNTRRCSALFDSRSW